MTKRERQRARLRRNLKMLAEMEARENTPERRAIAKQDVWILRIAVLSLLAVGIGILFL